MLRACPVIVSIPLTHAIKFNPSKIVGMLFPSPTLKLNFQPNINLDGCAIKFVSDVKYLGVCLNLLINMVKMMLTLTGKYDIYIALPTPLDLNFIDALNQ